VMAMDMKRKMLLAGCIACLCVATSMAFPNSGPFAQLLKSLLDLEQRVSDLEERVNDIAALPELAVERQCRAATGIPDQGNWRKLLRKRDCIIQWCGEGDLVLSDFVVNGRPYDTWVTYPESHPAPFVLLKGESLSISAGDSGILTDLQFTAHFANGTSKTLTYSWPAT